MENKNKNEAMCKLSVLASFPVYLLVFFHFYTRAIRTDGVFPLLEQMFWMMMISFILNLFSNFISIICLLMMLTV
jgi:hypothetical protein